MRVHGAFLADEVYRLPNGGLSIVKAGIVRRIVPTAMRSFLTNVVLVCEMSPNDVGLTHELRAELMGPAGELIEEYKTNVAADNRTSLLSAPLTIQISPERVGTHMLRIQLGGYEPVCAQFDLEYEVKGNLPYC